MLPVFCLTETPVLFIGLETAVVALQRTNSTFFHSISLCTRNKFSVHVVISKDVATMQMSYRFDEDPWKSTFLTSSPSIHRKSWERSSIIVTYYDIISFQHETSYYEALFLRLQSCRCSLRWLLPSSKAGLPCCMEQCRLSSANQRLSSLKFRLHCSLLFHVTWMNVVAWTNSKNMFC